jgi:hypothetical protein
MDVFSFGLILYEILVEQRGFPSAMSTTVIMRKELNRQRRDCPGIPTRLHKDLQEVISHIWVSVATKRPRMETHWKRIGGVGFTLLPGVKVNFIPLTQENSSALSLHRFVIRSMDFEGRNSGQWRKSWLPTKS